MYVIGAVLGLIIASLPTYLLGLLAGLFFKSKEPDERSIIAALFAWVIVYLIAGLGRADGGSFRFEAGLPYILSAVLAFFMLRGHYRRMWQPDDLEKLEKTFE